MPPLSVHEILADELRALRGRRVHPDDAFKRLHQARLSALCLSGGGIRSATFSLGVIQGLARLGLLDAFDYLSTVSGGGFVGGWLSSWIARTSVDEVQLALSSVPRDPLAPEPEPVQHLRAFSNYLTPRPGIFSADTWTLVATYVRNLLLNWLTFVPPLIALLSLPILLAQGIGWQPVGDGTTLQFVIGICFALLASAGLVAAVRYTHLNRPRQRGNTEGTGTYDERASQRDFLWQCLIPLVIAALLAAIVWAWATSYASPVADFFGDHPAWHIVATAGAVIHLAGWLLARGGLRRRHGLALPLRHAITVTASGAAVGAIVGLLARYAPPLWDLDARERGEYICLAVPVLLGAMLCGSWLFVGYTSTRRSDAEREWSARFTGWLMIAIVSWLAIFALVIDAPAILAVVTHYFAANRTLLIRDGLAIAGLAAGGGAAWLAKRGAGRGWQLKLALAMSALFMVALVMVLSAAGGALIAQVQRLAGAGDAGSTAALLAAKLTLIALFLFGVITSRFIDSNRFSLHALYRSRLIRAWLGASRPTSTRRPNPFTGFDDADNVHLRDLRPGRAGVDRGPPLHIINATLNVVSGEKLAWQERKAESFTFSPLHCGSAQVGYRSTQDDPGNPDSGGFGGDRGVSLGTALAISGAAASPQMGYHSSPLLALVLTFFNVRLGWWLGNPGPAGERVYHRSSPRSSLAPIVAEAFGRTTDASAYVYLSDGGHFENLGLYEMVLRRCHIIVVVDATADSGNGARDLGNAIRKIRVDFGIPIEMTAPAVRDVPVSIGVIRYDAVDHAATNGVIVRIAPAVGPDSSTDVRAYAEEVPAFPRESTIDQWFTESQFESYRELGLQSVASLAAERLPDEGASLPWLVRQALRRVER